MAHGATLTCDDCGLTETVLMGPLMSGVELTTCACRSCRGFVTLEHSWGRDELRPDLICPECAGPVEPIDLDGGRVIALTLGERRDEEVAPVGEPAAVDCPACGGELHADGTLLAD